MSFDFDLFVIGAGSGGVRAARFAAGFGAKVGIAESRYLGVPASTLAAYPRSCWSTVLTSMRISNSRRGSVGLTRT